MATYMHAQLTAQGKMGSKIPLLYEETGLRCAMLVISSSPNPILRLETLSTPLHHLLQLVMLISKCTQGTIRNKHQLNKPSWKHITWNVLCKIHSLGWYLLLYAKHPKFRRSNAEKFQQQSDKLKNTSQKGRPEFAASSCSTASCCVQNTSAHSLQLRHYPMVFPPFILQLHHLYHLSHFIFTSAKTEEEQTEKLKRDVKVEKVEQRRDK